jgi:hypothetical protein
MPTYTGFKVKGLCWTDSESCKAAVSTIVAIPPPATTTKGNGDLAAGIHLINNNIILGIQHGTA